MYKIIQELEADNSRLAKEAILEREATAMNTELFAGVHLALNNYITFGVKKVPKFTGPVIELSVFIIFNMPSIRSST